MHATPSARRHVTRVGETRQALCEPVLIEMPGWSESTVGTRSMDKLPQAARDYLSKVEELCGAPIDIISTGPDREETLVKRHPFE